MNSSTDVDVAIVGAGLAGSSAAIVLARKGVRVLLIDSRRTYQACFRAEKIEWDQAELLRKLCLMDELLPLVTRISTVISTRNRDIIRKRQVEQYGIFYQDIVNGVRKQLPSSVAWKTSRVMDISPGAEVSTLRLIGGETVTARLIVLACGTGGNLRGRLGIQKQMIQPDQSFAIGFNIAPDSKMPFVFDGLTVYPDGTETRIAFLTLFPIRNAMRANLFVYRLPGEEWVTKFKQKPHETLICGLPDLERFTGGFYVTSRVEMCPVDLYRVSGHVQPGLVLIGDSYQSVCPTTGMGLSKVLTDVDALGRYVPEWLHTSRMDIDKISFFYSDAQKQSCDERAIRQAQLCRRISIDESYLWQMCREFKYSALRMAMEMKNATEFLPKENVERIFRRRAS